MVGREGRKVVQKDICETFAIPSKGAAAGRSSEEQQESASV